MTPVPVADPYPPLTLVPAAPLLPRPAAAGCRLDPGATDADDTTGAGDARVGCLEGSNAAGLGLTTGAAGCARAAGLALVVVVAVAVVVVWGLPSGLRPAAAAAAGGGPGGSGGTNGASATASAEASVDAFAAFGRCGGLPNPG